VKNVCSDRDNTSLSESFTVKENRNTNKVYRQTQHFTAIQQGAAGFGSKEPTSGTFITEV